MSPYARDMWRFAFRCIIAFITGPMEFLIALAIFIPVMAVIVGGTAAIHALGWYGLLSPRTVRKLTYSPREQNVSPQPR